VAVPRIIVTSGEPAGIGPDTCVLLAQRDSPVDLVFAGDASVLAGAAESLALPLSLVRYDPAKPATRQAAGILKVLDLPAATTVVPGKLDGRNAAYVIGMLDRACDGCLSGEFAAMVTAPVQKSTLIEAGFDFTGHTEYLAARCGAPLPVMMLLADRLRVALVTTHLALAEVSRAITRDRLLTTLRIVHHDVARFFALEAPRIMVLGLNPHAGEAGHLGREEIEIIEPALAELRAEGLDLRGPVPADTAFAPGFLADADVVVAMYHDQGLPVLKHVGFGNAVNMTLGLPILRLSVDHGTALSLARTGKADGGSLAAAFALASQLVDAAAKHAGP
jgi:4-hydroxythreonine-4-phosphate dehydrogenase